MNFSSRIFSRVGLFFNCFVRSLFDMNSIPEDLKLTDHSKTHTDVITIG